MSEKHTVIFTPSGKRGQFASGTPVLEAARRLGVDLDSVCGGRGICSKCQITPSFGDFPKFGVASKAASLSKWNAVEERYDSIRGLPKGRRLGCQAKIEGDVVIDVPPESQVHKQVIRKRAEARDITIDPSVRLLFVEVEEPDMHKPSGDFERLQGALKAEWGVEARASLSTLAALQATLRKGKWQVTCAYHVPSGQILQIWPGYHDSPLYGLAVDLGSTTIAAHLCDLATGEVLASSGLMNPQIRFGEDLMSRVSYVMMNPGGDVEMTAVVRTAINDLIGEIASMANITRNDIFELVLVANPIMHHLFLGLDPVELGQAPFALAVSDSQSFAAREVGLEMQHNAQIYTLPCIAGHVGADAAAVALSEAPNLSEDLVLIVDVGTNAEILLGNKERVLACSSPTGPAFEGAQISSGQRAAPGAIEHIRIGTDKEPVFKLVGNDRWSNEAGFEQSIAQTGITGICGSGIIEAIAEMRMAGIVDASGLIGSAEQAGTPRCISDGRTNAYVVYEGGSGPKITVTNGDIRAIQLAKAALYAGARLLMDKLKVDTVDRVVLAGAFGAHISPKHAMVLGMIPDCPVEQVTSAGNAAGTGARIALLNLASRAEIEATVRKIEKIETAIEPKFQEHFVEATNIPHATAPFSGLRATTPLPDVNFNTKSDKPRRRKRRTQLE
ncbi:MAG: ASKHA domain-containing protein [Rhodobacteraceae bacterium]|nr:ASKHA domain-containing protein [Paracoccaceae bacterium]